MSSANIDIEVTLERGDDEIYVSCNVDLSHQAARLYGPPEDCWPEETECNINNAIDEDGKDILSTLGQKDIDRIEEDAWEEMNNRWE